TGNFNLRVNNERSDEIGRSARALDALLETTETAIAKVLNLANSVVKAINEIAQGSQNLSQRTQEQASALEETASSMEQMTATVGQNSERAKQANHVAIESREQTDKGVTVMSQTIDAMRTIQDSSKQIEEIVSLIDGIAFQINLLALNAAVEAARAGEHGRGFAVVAGEVRSLAQKSAEAAKDIKTLINSTVKQIENGTHLVDETGSALNSINTAIKRVGDIIAEISSASAEQRVGIEQVNKAIVSMDEVTQQNASLVEEMAAAATTMKDLAYEMKQAISFFQVQHTLLEKVEPNEMNASESLSEKNTIPHYAPINKENHNNPEWEHF
ncbi:MAG: methyl-accepting chemotaxis protein, partial [Pseudomonadota bacterium]|nr:methyl-accepting chemotaxis protein [Pseudomonadota bacterium]